MCGKQSETDQENSEIDLNVRTTAKRVNDKVLIRRRDGNLVNKLFLSEEEIKRALELVE